MKEKRIQILEREVEQLKEEVSRLYKLLSPSRSSHRGRRATGAIIDEFPLEAHEELPPSKISSR